MARAGLHCRFLNRAALYLGNAGGNADYHSRAGKNGIVEHLFDENLKHACRNVKVGDNAVLKRAYGDNGAGGAAYDVLCFLTDIAHGVGAGVHRDHGRLAHDYALAF